MLRSRLRWTGATDDELKNMDRKVHQAQEGAKHKSVFACAVVWGKLPSTAAALAAPLAWARGVFDETLPDHLLQHAWKQGILRVAVKPGTSTRARGPAEAIARSLARLGWKSIGPKTWRAENGELIDLREEAPDLCRRF